VADLGALPPARAVLLDVPPRAFLRMAGDRLPGRYRRALEGFRPGPGVFKLDWALDGPIPWANPDVGRAGTVHLGGTLGEIAEAEAAVHEGRLPPNPYVLLAQPSLFDPTRAPEGKHTAWAYCHVPNGSAADMTRPIEDQVERFAPGFRDRILERHAFFPADLEAADANLLGGDVTGGDNALWQLAARPVLRPNPYRTPLDGVYLCSASTPPGGGVHGMCGYHAAGAALREAFG
jgi:phytoene dehydrogenase-like protein